VYLCNQAPAVQNDTDWGLKICRLCLCFHLIIVVLLVLMGFYQENGILRFTRMIIV